MRHHTSPGLTLVELLVAISIFAITSLMITTSFLTLLDTRRQTDARQQIFDEFRLISENLSREVVVAKDFVPVCSGSTCPEVRLITTTREEFSPRLIIYKFQNGQILKAEQRDFGVCKERVNVGGSYTLPEGCFVPISSPILTLEYVDFEVMNNNDETRKPLLVFSVRGTIQAGTGNSQPFSFSRSITTQPVQGSDDAIGSDDRPPDLVVLGHTINAAAKTATINGTVSDTYGVVQIDVWNNDLYMEGSPSKGRYFLIYPNPPGIGSYTTGTGAWSVTIPLQPAINNNLVFSAADTSHNTSTVSYIIDATALSPEPPPPFPLKVSRDCLLSSGTPGIRLFLHGNEGGVIWPTVARMPWQLYKCTTTVSGTCDPRSPANLYTTIISTDTDGDGEVDGYTRDRWENPNYGVDRWCYSARYWDILHNVFSVWSPVECVTASLLKIDDVTPMGNCPVGGGSTTGSTGSTGSGGGGSSSSSGGTSSGRPPRDSGGGTR